MGVKFRDLSVLYFITSYKPRCYLRISRPEKSRNNTQKNTINFHVRLISQSAADNCHSLLASLGRDDEYMAKSSSKVVCRNFFALWLLKH